MSSTTRYPRHLLLAACLLFPAQPNKAAEPNQVDLLLNLNGCFIQSVQTETPPPTLTARNLAIFHLAIAQAADAANSAKLPVAPAVASAGQTVGAILFPSRASQFEILANDSRRRTGATSNHAKAASIGTTIAHAWLEARADDGSGTTVHYVPSAQPGQWRRTPPSFRPPELPHWGMTRPFLLPSPTALRPEPPPSLASAEYASNWDEARRLGATASTDRTDDQKLAARFWSDFSYTPGPPGHWNQIAYNLIVISFTCPHLSTFLQFKSHD